MNHRLIILLIVKWSKFTFEKECVLSIYTEVSGSDTHHSVPCLSGQDILKWILFLPHTVWGNVTKINTNTF